jgi:hypothetical protein
MVARQDAALMEVTMGEVIAFKPRMSAQDKAQYERRWFCELLGIAKLAGLMPETARQLFKVRFGVMPKKGDFVIAICPSAAVELWVMENFTGLYRPLTPGELRARDVASNEDWGKVCSALPIRAKRVQA